LSLQDKFLNWPVPATLWLANFQRRSATQGTEKVMRFHPTSDDDTKLA